MKGHIFRPHIWRRHQNENEFSHATVMQSHFKCSLPRMQLLNRDRLYLPSNFGVSRLSFAHVLNNLRLQTDLEISPIMKAHHTDNLYGDDSGVCFILRLSFTLTFGALCRVSVRCWGLRSPSSLWVVARLLCERQLGSQRADLSSPIRILLSSVQLLYSLMAWFSTVVSRIYEINSDRYQLSDGGVMNFFCRWSGGRYCILIPVLPWFRLCHKIMPLTVDDNKSNKKVFHTSTLKMYTFVYPVFW